MSILEKITPGKFDKKILPLVKALNKVGIKTIASCAGHKYKIYKTKAYLAIEMSHNDVEVRIHEGILCIDWDWQKK